MTALTLASGEGRTRPAPDPVTTGIGRGVPMHGNVGSVLLTEPYRELFTALATCAAGLIGLLFVAISVAPRDGKPTQPAVIHHVRAASALVAFTNALVVSLFGLVPGNSAGKVAIAVGAVGILFTAASVRSIVTSSDVSWEQAIAAGRPDHAAAGGLRR